MVLQGRFTKLLSLVVQELPSVTSLIIIVLFSYKVFASKYKYYHFYNGDEESTREAVIEANTSDCG